MTGENLWQKLQKVFAKFEINDRIKDREDRRNYHGKEYSKKYFKRKKVWNV